MRGMQLIIPPIEEDDISPPQDGDSMERLGRSSYSERGDSDNQGVISDELRQNFEAMKEVWREADRESEADAAMLEELRHKERSQAIETALAVESEIAKWQVGIAELEALLAAGTDEDDAEVAMSYPEEERGSNEDQVVGDRQPQPPFAAIRFPTLPPVIVPDDDDNTLDDL